MLQSFFSPKSVAVVGVSADATKIGAAVFNNLIGGGFQGKLYAVNPKYAGGELYGRPCVASLRDISPAPELVISVVPARFTKAVAEEAAECGVRHLSVITAGFGEAGNHELEKEIADICLKADMSLLGPNCLGHISPYTNLNASFADGQPRRGNIAFISQSGAYCSALMDWAHEKGIGFSHFISIGNKTLLAEDTLLNALKDDPHTDAFVFYLESLKNGPAFLKVIREVSAKKPVVILEPGRSAKAQAASLSHTGSLAPNYRILEMALKKAGAIQVQTSRELFDLIELLQYARNTDFEEPLAIVTNAGGVGVLSSDLCEKFNLDLKRPSEALEKNLREGLPAEAAYGNPIDVIGDAKADRYEYAVDRLCASGEYRHIFVLLTPQSATDAPGTAQVLVKLQERYPNINIFASFIGGVHVAQGVSILKQNKIMHVDYPIDLIGLLGLLKAQKKERCKKEISCAPQAVPTELKQAVAAEKAQGGSSLSSDLASKILDHYGLDYPKSGFFTDKAKALAFCNAIFPNAVVLKLSAPDAVHKTEMKGIFLNITDENGFNQSWDALQAIIEKHGLKNAGVLVQEMIKNAVEIIMGVTSDKNFGRVLMFGTGGVYTEVWQDTSVRVLPTDDFDDMISETKAGTILKGVRGEKPRAVDKVIETMAALQRLATDFPEIDSLDANPVLVTSDRAVLADVKLILKA